ncbi:MAG: chemotaxis protein CheW [Planctomycetota bacterium]|nr:chemotaxis protein CheW [Planctomycetota bacterium]
MSSESDPIIAEFVVESREHLADIENQLLAIEAAGADINVDLVNEVFRAVHSIKGASGFLGFSTLGSLAHSLENVLNLIRNRELVPDTANVDVMLRAADVLSGMIEDIHQSNDVDIAEHVTALERVVVADGGEKIDVDVEDATPETVAADPATQSSAATTRPREEETASAKSAEPQASIQAQQKETTPVEVATPQTPPQPQPPPQAAAQRPANPPAAADANIRVSVGLLDSLMNLAGELVLSRNQLIQAVGSADGAGLDSVAGRLDQVTSELQEAIMQTRMQVVGTVFGKFPRVVRDLSKQLDKQCRLTLEGEDVELDKSIIEAIGDPLTHLVRNSVDHGIESPQQRIEAGKPAGGTVVLRAFHQAGKVNISISDDGAGIDVSRLKEKAVARGIITSEQAGEMSEREALRLIFHPGFSMAEKVTGVSGRGVGMDVVKTNIEKLGGAVGIDTRIGAGTTINIKLPLTLAIIPSLIVRCRKNRFAIPQAGIRELVRIKAGDVEKKIERIKNAEVFRLRGNLLPLVRLERALDLHAETDEKEKGPVNIIVVETGHLQYGLIVDGLHDSEEIVVKPLGRHMQDCHCLAGATILGDGQVALILDVAGIASRSELALHDEEGMADADNSHATDNVESQTMLLFTNDPKEQFGIPMAVIVRLERVLANQIDSVGGREVLQYRGASLPLLRLENHIKAGPPPHTRKVYVVVFSVRGREVGLIVPTLVDIREVPTNVDTSTFSEPGVIGSVEMNEKAMRLLDLYKLTQAAYPELFAESERIEAGHVRNTLEDEDGGRVPMILVAEDSGFFRRQVTGYLEEAGYEVVGCEDGLIAWNTLQERGGDFDLVVTDVEMPNMDGCQLARHIKDDPTLAHLPIIALTSLASEEDMQRGMEAGIDDYQVKLDRERMMGSVAKYLEKIKSRTGSSRKPAAVGIGG